MATWRGLKRRAMVSVKGQAHFLHIGKTGGSAVHAALAPHELDGRYVLRLHGHGVTLDDLPAGQPFFLAFRDPCTRFVSAFYSRQRRGRPRYDIPWTPEEEAAFARFGTANQLAEAIGTPEGDQAMRTVGHVSAFQADWVGGVDGWERRRGECIGALRQEHLTEDFAALTAALGLAGVALPDDDLAAHRTTEAVDRSLSPLATDNLRAWYRRDVELLGHVEATAGDR